MNNILSNPVTSVGMAIVITTIITITVVIIIEKAMPAILKKYRNVEKGIDTAKAIVDKTGTIIEIADSILPTNKVIDILQIIEKWAKKSVDSAEQLCNASKLEKEQKNDKAKEEVYTVLKLLNIEKTPEIEKIINAAIEAEVFALNCK